MITVHTENLTPISQDFYDKVIDSLNISSLPCTCGHSGCLIRYGSYLRKFKGTFECVTLRIARVRCQSCGRTHALLLSSMVPFSQIPLTFQAALIHCSEQNRGLRTLLDQQACIDECRAASLIRAYRRHWRERLLSLSHAPLSLHELISACFQAFSRQFMQIKNTPNQLFLLPT